MHSKILKHVQVCMFTAGPMFYAKPDNACAPLINTQELSGAVVLVERGSCSFMEKAVNVEKAGALGMIVVNNVISEAAFAMGFDRHEHSMNITAMMVNKDAGQTLRHPQDDPDDEAPLLLVELIDLLNATQSPGQSVYMEQHVYVPDATQSWLENNDDLTKLAHQGSLTWQSLLSDLAASIHSVQN